MEPTPDYIQGTFKSNEKTYHVHIERGEAKLELKDMSEVERKALLDNAITIFNKNIRQQTEVKRAVFTTHDTFLELEFFGNEKSVKQLSLMDNPEAAKVDSYIRSLALNDDSTLPPTKFEGVGLERKAGETTCYANTLLQLQFHLLKGKNLPPYETGGNPVPQVDAGRKELWEAISALLKEMKEAKKAKKSVGKKSVMKVLEAATKIKKALGQPDINWGNLKKTYDLMELWIFINEQLPTLNAPHFDKKDSLYDDFHNGYAISVQPKDKSSLETLAQEKISKAKSQKLPETLPFFVNRFDDKGKKEYKGVEVASTMSLIYGNKKVEYELIGAAEHVGHATFEKNKVVNRGHYIAYTRTDKGAFMQRDDAKVTSMGADQATKRLATTGVLFFYRKKL